MIGSRSTTFDNTSMVKAILLIGAIFIIALLVLARFSFNPFTVFDEAATQLVDLEE